MFNSKTKMLLAALLGATGIKHVNPYGKFGTRTVKLRPANYTHPMIVSNDHQIAGWNKQVRAKKNMRENERHIKANKLKLTMMDLGISYVPSAKTSAIIRKQLRLATGIPAV